MAEIVTSPAEQAKWKQLHALALATYQAQQRAIALRRAGNEGAAFGQVQTVQTLRGLMGTKVAEIQTMTQDDLSPFDRIVLQVGDWVVAFLQALPATVAAIPNALVEGLGLIARKAGTEAGKALLPVAIGAIAVLLLAERSSTVRRLVR